MHLQISEDIREQQFDELREHIHIAGDNILILGDFIAIYNHSEKEGGSEKSQTSIDKFVNWINFGSLVDLGMIGSGFTWSNKRFGGKIIRERLDRVLVFAH